MTAALAPAEFEFRLPAGWRAVGWQAEPGTGEAAYVLVEVATAESGFATNITLTGLLRPSQQSLDQVADESIRRLWTSVPDLDIVSRGSFGDPAAPAFGQQLQLTTTVDGTDWDVVQAEIYFSKVLEDDPQQSIVRAVLTTTTARFDSAIEDFDEFLATLRFVPAG